MSDKMTPIPFKNLLDWIFTEYQNSNSIFGINASRFFKKTKKQSLSIFDEQIETPVGPAAGPHTQLSQNLIVSYLVGSRFFELKTVQQLDQLEVKKPCIDAQDECYNIEWSQELRLEQSYDEYLKAWILIHLLKELFGLSAPEDKGFVFNMSVGYDLAGIKTPAMDLFIEQLKDASSSEKFDHYKKETILFLRQKHQPFFKKLGLDVAALETILKKVENISSQISSSVTLSTMHGCPPEDIEAIATYLMEEKKLNTYVKLNPTLLGYKKVRAMLDELGFGYIPMDAGSFDHDLQYADAVPMLKRLLGVAGEGQCAFGVKLSNTLGVINKKKKLADGQMYMSGRSLFPLTIHLAAKLADEFDGTLRISYSGGADQNNIEKILSVGIYPVTLVSDLLKPGGYMRLTPMVEKAEAHHYEEWLPAKIDLPALKEFASAALQESVYKKESRKIESIKVPEKLGKYDCYMAPCQAACPIHQDVAAYIRLVEEGRYEEAFEAIIARNPLPYITGYICDHQCQNHCTRWDYDSPVQIRDLKKEAAIKGYDAYRSRFKTERQMARNNIPVAVVGAGPSGLAFAYFMARAGFDVTVLEKNEQAGGVVQTALPDFRLPQEAIDKDIAFVKEHGVKFIFGVDAHFSIQQLKQDYKYIYIAIGAGKSRQLDLDGANGNLIDAIPFLEKYNQKMAPDLGTYVAIVGGGNSAMDAARAAKRTEGVEQVYILYRRTEKEMPADHEEFDGALDDGVQYQELVLPIHFKDGLLTCQKMQLGERGADGRRKVFPVKDEVIDLRIDSIISAIGEFVDKDLLKANAVVFDDLGNVIFNPESNQLKQENIFMGGDALHGPATVVEAIADAKKAAEAIIEKVKGRIPVKPAFGHLFDSGKRGEDILQKKAVISPLQQVAASEAERCLGCSFVCDKCVDVCPNRANIVLDSALFENGFEKSGQILHMDGMCNECGNCETFCPYSGAPYKDKITLFWDEESFKTSSNEGFYFVDGDGAEKVKIMFRFQGELDMIEMDAGNFTPSSNTDFNNQEFKTFLDFAKTVYANYDYLVI